MFLPKVKPLYNRVFVKRKKATLSKGGIILSEASQEKPQQGEILAIGEGKMNDQGKLVPLELKVGDQILFSSYGGTNYPSDDEENDYLILSEEDILAVIETN